MSVKNLVLTVLSSLLLTACHSGVLYSRFQSVPIDGWSADSIVRFEIPVADTIHPCNVLLYVRHTDAYAYQNMWLFVTENNCTDTIEFYLATDRGQWLGNGHSIKEMPILFCENIVLKDSVYTIAVQHGMREEALKGVSEIGVEVVRLKVKG